MNKAQQLLSRAMNALTLGGCDWLAEEIREYLAEPTQDEGPIGRVVQNASGQIYVEGQFGGAFDLPRYLGKNLYLHPAPRSAAQDENPVAFISKNGFRFNADIEPIEHGLEVPLYLHPAPRPEFVRLSEEEVNSLTYAPYEPYELICAVENRLVEKNRVREETDR